MEHICDIIKLTYKSKWEEIINSLLEKYGNKNHKKNQNILLKEIMKIFNWTSDITEENNLEKNYQKIKSKEIKQVNPQNDIKNDLVKQNQNSINILNINLILLSIKIVLSKDDEEIDFYINQYQQFLIFCILASINLHSSVKNYEQIQNILSSFDRFSGNEILSEIMSKFKIYYIIFLAMDFLSLRHAKKINMMN